MPPDDVRLLAAGRTAEIFSWEPDQVLKLYRPDFQGGLPEFERSVTRAVQSAGIPAPQVGDIITHAGRKGLPMQRVDGTSQFAGLQRSPWRAAAYGRSLAELQSRMHTAPGTGLPPMRERLEWKIQRASALPTHLRQAALAALEKMPFGDRVCHGDFHPDNVLETSSGSVIIDWTDATCGTPLADVARTALLVRHATLPPGNPLTLLITFARGIFYNAYIKRYFELSPGNPADIAAWLPIIAAARLSEGITSEENNLLSMAARLEEQ